MPTPIRLAICAVLAIAWAITGVGLIWVALAIGCAFLAPYRGRAADVGLHMGLWWGVFYLAYLALQQPTKWTAPEQGRSGGHVSLPPSRGASRFD